MFAYLSVECPPRLVAPRTRTQAQMEKNLVRLKENFIHVNYFDILFKEERKQKLSKIKNKTHTF